LLHPASVDAHYTLLTFRCNPFCNKSADFATHGRNILPDAQFLDVMARLRRARISLADTVCYLRLHGAAN
ncbi:hypothetical protein, partial [Atlantibacter hermannii]|uniref:hypothetical protein n=1 Tax=Atlantibacter hermannii TaxID=565 RepID=UPI001EE3F74C